jgi:ubiquinone/menaquinone biosynthesis C-methylase UbiE
MLNDRTVMSSPTQDYLARPLDWRDPQFPLVYDELPLWSAMAGLILLAHVPLRPNTRLLDVGCGTGFPLLELAERLGPTCRAVGLDPWTYAMDRAQVKIDHCGIHHVTLVRADAANMPLEASSFDLIVSNLGLNNFDDPAAALRECHRVAAPGATLALTTNLQGHMLEFYEIFAQSLKQQGMESQMSALGAHVAHRTTTSRLESLLKETGFSVCRVLTSETPMRYLDGSALLRHKLVRQGFLDAWRQVVKGADERLLFSTLEANLNAAAASRGGLTLTIPFAYVEAVKDE